MKSLFLRLLLVYLLQGLEGKEEKYTTKYDGINLEEILANERLLTGYVNCLLEQGPCTPDGKELKRNLPDAIGSDCAKCTERQKQGADEVMEYIIDHRPDDWTKLEHKYQSDGSYRRKYLESANSFNKSETSKENTMADQETPKKITPMTMNNQTQ